MASDILSSIRARLSDELHGLTMVGEGLSAPLECRYGDLSLEIDHDAEAESIRVCISVPPPLGAGPEFLVFCLATNTQYWDVKAGLDDEGFLIVHSDLDADESTDISVLSAMVIDRAETIVEFLDEIADWLLPRQLGTPAQLSRWRERKSDED